MEKIHRRALSWEMQDLKRTAWSSTSIHAVVSDLSGRGFDCYWAGANGTLALA